MLCTPTGPRPPLAVAVALMLALATSCGSPSADGTAGDGALARGDFERALLLTGELEAVHSLDIKAPQTSLFQMRIQFMAEEGSVVKAGEPLLSFDNSSLASQVRDLEVRILDAETQTVARRNQLASALKDIEIELAEKTYERDRSKLLASVSPEVLARKLHAERQLAHDKAQSELEETEARVGLTRRRGVAELDVLEIEKDKLEADLLQARRGLELVAIAAPADGLVVYERRGGTTLRYQEGDSCWPGQGVMRLPDLSEMQVSFLVSEVDAPLLSVGMPVDVQLDSFPGRRLRGEIKFIPSMAVKRTEDAKLAIFKVVASLEETWVGEMKPGMSVQGRVVLDRRTDVPLVSRAAVEHEGDAYEFGGRPITPLARSAGHYVVSEDDFARLGGRARRGFTAGGGSS